MKHLLVLAALLLGVGCTDYKVGDCIVVIDHSGRIDIANVVKWDIFGYQFVKTTDGRFVEVDAFRAYYQCGEIEL